MAGIYGRSQKMNSALPNAAFSRQKILRKSCVLDLGILHYSIMSAEIASAQGKRLLSRSCAGRFIGQPHSRQHKKDEQSRPASDARQRQYFVS